MCFVFRCVFVHAWACVSVIGRVPTTPDPNTSAQVSRYKWEPWRDTRCRCEDYFL